MPTIQRIMLPTGFSDLSRRAASYAATICPWAHAELHAVHVIPDSQVFVDPSVPGAGIPIVAPGGGDSRAAAQASLDAFVKDTLGPAAAAGVTIRTFILSGQIAEELVTHAETHKIDLIIMGTHADGMVKRVIWGSMGKSVLEHSPCPVLLVPVRDAKR